MNQTILLKSMTLVGAIFAVSIAPAIANTPRGTSGINTGSEVAPLTRPTLTPTVPGIQVDQTGAIVLPAPIQTQFNQNLVAIVREIRAGGLQIPGFRGSLENQIAIADLLQSPGGLRYLEVVGELRAIVSQPAVPANEPGVETERPGFVRLDLKREGSIPASIASRFSRYAANLNTQGGEFTIFGNDRQGVSRNIQIVLVPRLDRQMEVRFTSNSTAMKGTDGQPMTRSFIAPNANVAAILAGVLPALDVANASPAMLNAATNIALSLGNLNLTAGEIQQLAQRLSETLIASGGLLTGCGKDTSALSCTDISVNAMAIAIRAYNDVIAKTRGDALIALANNPEFQILGEVLRRSRSAIAQTSR